MHRRFLRVLVTCGIALAAVAGMMCMATSAFASTTNNGMRLYAIHLAKADGGVTQYDPNDREAAEYGDAVLMESNGEYLLMDTGQGWCSQSLVAYLKNVGVEHLSIYISHVHPDHMDGVEAIANDGSFTIDALYYPDPSIASQWESDGGTSENRTAKLTGWCTANNASCQLISLQKGSTFTFQAVSAKVLGPVNTHSPSYYTKDNTQGYVLGGDTTKERQAGHYLNNKSLTTMFTCNGIKYLTCGDIEADEEAALVKEYGTALKADIFKLSHHGIYTSNTEAFIDKVKPTWTICENMAFNALNNMGKASDGESRDAYPTINALKAVQKYGFVYTVGDTYTGTVWHSFGLQVSSSKAVTLYKDADENGKWASSEKLSGWVSVCGIASTKTGDRAAPDKYYLKSNSKPTTGVAKIGKYRYYFGTGGCMEHGFYSTKSGHAWNGWQVYNSTGTKAWTSGKKYYRYFTASGVMVTGAYSAKLKDVSGKYHRFFFKSNGIRYSTTSTSKWYAVKYGSYKYAVNGNGVLWSSAEAKWKSNGGYITISGRSYKTNTYGRIIK